MINIIKGEDAIYHVEGYDVVLVGVDVYNMLSNGFQAKMKLKYPIIEEADATTGYGDMRKMGKRITIDSTKPIISLLYIARHPNSLKEFDYGVLESVLRSADEEFAGKRVITTLLGCSKFDGKADREKVLEIMNATVSKMELDVYDYEQLSKVDEFRRECEKLRGKGMSKYDKFVYIRDNFYVEWWKYGSEKMKKYQQKYNKVNGI